MNKEEFNIKVKNQLEVLNGELLASNVHCEIVFDANRVQQRSNVENETIIDNLLKQFYKTLIK